VTRFRGRTDYRSSLDTNTVLGNWTNGLLALLFTAHHDPKGDPGQDQPRAGSRAGTTAAHTL
jgi:hypothetical protein